MTDNATPAPDCFKEVVEGVAEPVQNHLVNDFMEMVTRFNTEVIGLPIPEKPTPLSGPRFDYAVAHLKEELKELTDSWMNPEWNYNEAAKAEKLEEQVDALIDLVYVALGRIVEMGVLPGPAFEQVHVANMAKQRGMKATRPGSLGHDAIKPEGWTPPDLAPVLRARVADLENIITAEDREVLAHLSPVLREVTLLRARKGRDYNTVVDLRDYFPDGHASYRQMVHVKSTRARALVGLMELGLTANFEGLRDTLLDLINYSVYWVEAVDDGSLIPAPARGLEDGTAA